ncbi:MAG: hypothetical protein JNL81_11145 [Hyphomonadaceae bacterium]|nr:hypothetical protein [Hyphomonadaceae bacterium]
MKYVLDRMVVTMRDRGDDISLIDAISNWFYEIHEEIGRVEIEPRCRAIGKMMMFEGPVSNGGIESYVSLYGWSENDADDILAGYTLINSPKRAAAFLRVREIMSATTELERRGMASRQGFMDIGSGKPNEELNAEVEKFYRLDEEDGDVHTLTLRYLRRHGLIKIVLSDAGIDREREAIMARSPWYAALEAHRAEQSARNQESARLRGDVITQLAKLASLRVNLSSGYGVRTADEIPKAGYVHGIITPFDANVDPVPKTVHVTEDGVSRRYALLGEVIYYEDGDRGVLARHPDGEVLAEVAVKPGSTNFQPNWKLPS